MKRKYSMSKKRNRRYYLHRKLKINGICYDIKSMTILVPYTRENELIKPASQLQKEFNYAKQIIIE